MMHIRPRRRHLYGFSLIELIVAVVIVGALAGIGTVGYRHVMARSQDEAVEVQARSVLSEARALTLLDTGTELVARWDVAMTSAAADLSAAGVTLVGETGESTGPDVMAYGLTDDWGVEYVGLAIRVHAGELSTVFCRILADGAGSVECMTDNTDEGTATGENAALLSSEQSTDLLHPPPAAGHG